MRFIIGSTWILMNDSSMLHTEMWLTSPMPMSSSAGMDMPVARRWRAPSLYYLSRSDSSEENVIGLSCILPMYSPGISMNCGTTPAATPRPLRDACAARAIWLNTSVADWGTVAESEGPLDISAGSQ